MVFQKCKSFWNNQVHPITRNHDNYDRTSQKMMHDHDVEQPLWPEIINYLPTAMHNWLGKTLLGSIQDSQMLLRFAKEQARKAPSYTSSKLRLTD